MLLTIAAFIVITQASAPARNAPGTIRLTMTPKSPSQWRHEAARLRGEWTRVLGDLADSRPRARFEVLDEETAGSVIRRRIRFEVESNVWSEAYLLLPRSLKGRAPGIVVFHSTVPYDMRQPAGLEGPADMHIGLRLAERGYVAICPRCFIFETAPSGYLKTVEAWHAKHPGWTGMARMLRDGRCALDVLAALPEVDRNRLGAIGHSLGGKETLYLAAFDSRVKAAVSSEGGIGLSFSNWEAPWYLGDQIKRPDFGHDHHELLALCAPRAFLLLGGESADGDKSAPYIEAARLVYALSNRSENLEFVNHRHGHAFPAQAQEAAWSWLDRHLRPTSGSTQVPRSHGPARDKGHQHDVTTR